MKYIVYFGTIYGPYRSQLAADKKAEVAGWRSYDVVDSLEEAESIAALEVA